MSRSGNSRGLPFLPGYTFRDITKSAYHRPQTLDYKNGYARPRRPTVGIGQEPLFSEQLIQQEIDELSYRYPDMYEDSSEQGLTQQFIPAHVALDKKVLRFFGFFQESVLFSPDEEYRVRPVVIYYYLEDDSICIIEPGVENSGIPQGKRIKRQRLPKNRSGAHYLWRDLNLGMDLEAYGVRYHITQCDNFTKEFLESEGLVLNDPEQIPVDPYSQRRQPPQHSFTTPSEVDSMHRFLTLDRKVLRFFALWDDLNALTRESRPVTIHFFLVDDTVEIREARQPNSGRDPFPVLIRRQKLPKKLKPEAEMFPRCVMEVSKPEVDEYLSPRDFQLGQTVSLLGRHFLLYDCDGFTKDYYQKNFSEMEMKPVEIPKTRPPERKKEVPPYNGFGSLEDSLQNCLTLHPQPPKKDVLKMLLNGNKALRYSVRLDSQNPDDESRRFVLSFFLSDDMISIYEKPTLNCGGGRFLEKTRIPKPGSTVEKPDFYSPADFVIGATVEVFGHRFVLTDADHFVLKYLESVSDQIPEQTLDSLRLKLSVRTAETPRADPDGENVTAPSS
ncbi:EF-hand domain-containing protein 1 [Xyrichtys novacula]|uniref:EF-hand domain-containing protein 1 n=1 Tax=Xyrichtys novacula TaxID=13765 RepID=A0AAV1GUX5_XYRNO|nr:EF-hand domain-containing protein 1 [Xyrichtys novacula]